ncbi:MAG: hypothetical protein WC412_02115 [Candidatus Omnitrophota bacterium]|jgi:hypothetical protein
MPNTSQYHKELINELKRVMEHEGLKKGFLEVGKILHEIKENKTYKNIKPNDPHYTFEKYCMEAPDYLPGSSPAGRKSVISKLILIYKFFLANKNKLAKAELIPLGYTKSYELAKFYFRNPKESLRQPLKLGYQLKQNDFAKMLSAKGCKHEEVVTAKVCKKCKTIIKIMNQ